MTDAERIEALNLEIAALREDAALWESAAMYLKGAIETYVKASYLVSSVRPELQALKLAIDVVH
jgi:hypothetical protein